MNLWITLEKTTYVEFINNTDCPNRFFLMDIHPLPDSWYSLYEPVWWILELILKASTIIFNALSNIYIF